MPGLFIRKNNGIIKHHPCDVNEDAFILNSSLESGSCCCGCLRDATVYVLNQDLGVLYPYIVADDVVLYPGPTISQPVLDAGIAACGTPCKSYGFPYGSFNKECGNVNVGRLSLVTNRAEWCDTFAMQFFIITCDSDSPCNDECSMYIYVQNIDYNNSLERCVGPEDLGYEPCGCITTNANLWLPSTYCNCSQVNSDGYNVFWGPFGVDHSSCVSGVGCDLDEIYIGIIFSG